MLLTLSYEVFILIQLLRSFIHSSTWSCRSDWINVCACLSQEEKEGIGGGRWCPMGNLGLQRRLFSLLP